MLSVEWSTECLNSKLNTKHSKLIYEVRRRSDHRSPCRQRRRRRGQFQREKYIPRGGPDGGDGGRGGSIVRGCRPQPNTLIDYRYARIHRAGTASTAARRPVRKSAPDVVLRVRWATVVSDLESGERVADLIATAAARCLPRAAPAGSATCITSRA